MLRCLVEFEKWSWIGCLWLLPLRANQCFQPQTNYLRPTGVFLDTVGAMCGKATQNSSRAGACLSTVWTAGLCRCGAGVAAAFESLGPRLPGFLGSRLGDDLCIHLQFQLPVGWRGLPRRICLGSTRIMNNSKVLLAQTMVALEQLAGNLRAQPHP
jgi:hypothetical protein